MDQLVAMAMGETAGEAAGARAEEMTDEEERTKEHPESKPFSAASDGSASDWGDGFQTLSLDRDTLRERVRERERALPPGVLAGCSPERVKAEFAQLHASILSIGKREEFDEVPETNPWWEPAPGGESTALSPLPLIFSYKSEKSLCGAGLRARMRRVAAESQAPLFEEALDDYHREVAAAREKAAAEGVEMTEPGRLFVSANP